MTNTLQPLKRPKPIVPIVAGIAAAINAGVAAYYFLVSDSVWAGLGWLGATIVWAGYSLPSTIRTHRSMVKTWQRRMELRERLRQMDDELERRMRWLIERSKDQFIGGESS